MRIGAEIHTLTLANPSECDDLTVSVNGKTHSVKPLQISAFEWLLNVDGHSHLVYVADGENGKEIFIRGTHYLVVDADLEARSRSRRKRMDMQAGEVTPPMPASVVRVLVAVGDPVSKGQVLVVVSAMKMETTLYAPYGGTIKKINTSVGAQVMPGEILVEIQRQPEGEGDGT